MAAITAMAQNTATVKSFVETTDHIPSNDRHNDLNGNPCALIKVQVLDDIERVEGNRIGDIINNGVEKWIYMCKGSRNIKIHFKNHLPLTILFKDYHINGVESNRVYELVINVPKQSTVSSDDSRKGGVFRLNINPTNAIVNIWSEGSQRKAYRPQEDGELSITLPYGRYYYEISANGYYNKEGNVFISDNPYVETITLQHTQEWIAEQKRIEEQRLAEQKRLEEQRLAEQRRITEQKRLEAQRQKAIADSIAQAKTDSIARARELARVEEARIKAEQKAKEAREKKEKHDKLIANLEKLDRQPIVLGLKAGYNMATAKFGSKYQGTTGSIDGFHVGMTADFRLDNSFYLNTGLIYSSKGYTYEYYYNDIDEKGNCQCLDIPLMASIRLPLGKMVKLMLNAGPYTALAIGGKVKDNWNDSEESFSTAYNGFDYGLQAGLGLIIRHHIVIGVDYQLGLGSAYSNRNLMLGVGYRF